MLRSGIIFLLTLTLFNTPVVPQAIPSAHAASLILGGGGGEYKFKTGTFLDKRFRNVVRQRRDFSCGSAALATLLTYHYRLPMDEGVIIRNMMQMGDRAKIEKEGFSLLDMKAYLATIGLTANGYKEPLDKLTSVGIPGIALINMRGYLHFVVIQGVTKDKVLIADPSLGSRIMKRKEFEGMWNNILFVITDRMDLARGTFNTVAAWNLVPRAGIYNATINSSINELSRSTLDYSITPNYY